MANTNNATAAYNGLTRTKDEAEAVAITVVAMVGSGIFNQSLSSTGRVPVSTSTTNDSGFSFFTEYKENSK
jgi:hypothetical protein